MAIENEANTNIVENGNDMEIHGQLNTEKLDESPSQQNVADVNKNGVSKSSGCESYNGNDSYNKITQKINQEDLDNIPWARRISSKNSSNMTRNGAVDSSIKNERIIETQITCKSKSNVIEVTENSRKMRKSKLEETGDEEYPEKKKQKISEFSNLMKKKLVKKEVKEECETLSGKVHKKTKLSKVEVKEEPTSSGKTVKKRKKNEEEEEIWKWWEEQSPEQSDGSIKWRTLEHKGPLFAPDYIPIPKNVKFKYDGKEMELSRLTEEVASYYAKMLDHDYTSKSAFNHNFFKDWKKVMKPVEREKITDLKKCDFSQMHAYFLTENEKKKARSKEEKKVEKDEKEKEAKEYGFAVLDGYKQKIGNFRIEPPGLFRGRGEHPKMGCLKRRVQPEDVIINCSKGVNITPPTGHKWKEIRHDNTVTWLCSWTENVLGNNKYIMLNPSSKLKGQKDWEKFEKARKLKGYVGPIREQYVIDFKSKEMRIRQRAVALYFIDKLALRAGNEKDTEEAADTVGCCSLRCEHIKLHDEMDGQKYVVEFDFLGKDSIRYYNRVPVEKAVFKNLKIFMEGKEGTDDLFDRLDTSSLNAYLKELMDGLTAKVFRTYNASITLQEQLDKLTNPNDSIHEKLLSYNRANRQVAILCNHQRAIPKTHEKSMENLENKIKEKKKEYKDVKAQLKKDNKNDKLQKKYNRIKEQMNKLKTQRTDKDENKQIALGTSKLNYLDPRITVAWCKKYDVPVEKIFSKTHREKFRWAIDMAKEDFIF